MRRLAFSLLALFALISDRAFPQGATLSPANQLPLGRWVTSALSGASDNWWAVLPKGSTDGIQVCVVTEAFNPAVTVWEIVGHTPDGAHQVGSDYTFQPEALVIPPHARDFVGARPASDTVFVLILAMGGGRQRGPYHVHFAGPPPALQFDSVARGRVESCRPLSIWEFVGDRGDSLIVESAASSFAVRLELQDSTASRLAQQDANGVGRVALVAHRLSHAGRYRIVVSRSQASGWGPYSLRARVER